MSQKFLTSIDLTRNELLNARIQNLASEPSSPSSGSIYFDTSVKALRYYNGDGWISDSVNAISASFAINSINATNAQTASFINATGITIGTLPNGRLAGGSYTGITQISATSISASFFLGNGASITGIVSSSYSSKSANSDQLGGLSGSFYISRNNHTGVQLASTISDFDVQVRTTRLDQMASPSSAVSLNGQKITNLATPILDSDAATKAYVDSTAQGLDIKQSVRVASTANVVIATGGLLIIDGVTIDVGDRVLLKDQNTASENGIYVASSGAWVRASDADSSTKVTAGMFTFVEMGALNSDRGYVLTTNNPIVLGTTGLSFTQFSGAGTYSAGTGITLTGTVFAIDTVSGYGVRKVTATIGDGSALSFVITHNLNTQDIQVSVRETNSPFSLVFTDVEFTTVNTVTIRFSVAPTTNQYKVIIIG